MKYYDYFIILFSTFIIIYNDIKGSHTILNKIEDQKTQDYDYVIKLSDDPCSYHIEITDEYHHMNIIHPDSLEEFIQQDNL